MNGKTLKTAKTDLTECAVLDAERYARILGRQSFCLQPGRFDFGNRWEIRGFVGRVGLEPTKSYDDSFTGCSLCRLGIYPRRGRDLNPRGHLCPTCFQNRSIQPGSATSPSGEQDLNLRPSGSKPDTLTKLSYPLNFFQKKIGLVYSPGEGALQGWPSPGQFILSIYTLTSRPLSKTTTISERHDYFFRRSFKWQ